MLANKETLIDSISLIKFDNFIASELMPCLMT